MGWRLLSSQRGSDDDVLGSHDGARAFGSRPQDIRDRSRRVDADRRIGERMQLGRSTAENACLQAKLLGLPIGVYEDPDLGAKDGRYDRRKDVIDRAQRIT